MQVCVLASGSSGNSTYIASNDAKILIDAGISYSQINKRLNKFDSCLDDIDAIFISHEHVDHIRGVDKCLDHTQIFMSKITAQATKFNGFIKTFDNNSIKLKDLNIIPVKVNHDAVDPYGFLIENCNKTISIFTDIGSTNDKVNEAINKSDCTVLESNHDIDMLLNGPYPYELKQRIMGSSGHLSNIDAALLVKNHASVRLKNVMLTHLSERNNTADIAKTTFRALTNLSAKVAVPRKISQVIQV